MAYAAGDSILDDHYNGFLSGSTAGAYGINHIQGTGAGEYGLGLTALTGTSAGTTVAASQWNSLFTGMDNVANHTNDTLTSTAARSAGDSIDGVDIRYILYEEGPTEQHFSDWSQAQRILYSDSGDAVFAISGTTEVGQEISITESTADPDGTGTLSRIL